VSAEVVRQIFKMMPAPRPVVADLVHFEEVPDESPEYWTIRLYRDNFDKFPAEDRLVISNWVSDVIRNIRLIQPLVYLEVHERMPR
jgi:hypothetical protein